MNNLGLLMNTINKINDIENLGGTVGLQSLNIARGNYMWKSISKIPVELENCFIILANRKRYSPDPATHYFQETVIRTTITFALFCFSVTQPTFRFRIERSVFRIRLPRYSSTGMPQSTHTRV